MTPSETPVRTHPRRITLLVAALATTAALAAPALPAFAGASTCRVENDRTGKVDTAIQTAIGRARPGDTLLIAGGCAGHVNVAKALTLRGVRTSGTPTIDGTGLSSVLSIPSGVSATLQGVTITGASGNGMPIFVGGIATFRSVTVQGNVGAPGAMQVSGKATITGRSRIVDNVSTNQGGGIFVASTGTATVTGRTLIARNEAVAGGGITVQGGKLVLKGSARITGNSVTNNGGGINSYIGTVRIGGSAQIDGNSSGTAGGGISSFAGPLTILDSARIHDNHAPAASGGGVEITGGTLTIGGSVRIDHNDASNAGGGISAAETLAGSAISGAARIDHNTATDHGGGIALAVAAQLTISGTVSIDANVSQTGGGIAIMSGTVVLTKGPKGVHPQITGNTATNTGLGWRGGGIRLDSETDSHLTTSGSCPTYVSENTPDQVFQLWTGTDVCVPV